MRRSDALMVGRVPTHVDLAVYQGDDVFVQVVVDDTASPVDLTDYEPKAEIRAELGGELVAEFDAIILNSTTVVLHLPTAESTKLMADAVWDVQITDTAGQVTTLVYGAILTMREVTQ